MQVHLQEVQVLNEELTERVSQLLPSDGRGMIKNLKKRERRWKKRVNMAFTVSYFTKNMFYMIYYCNCS